MSLQSIGAQQSSAFRAGFIALVATLIAIAVFSPALLGLVGRWMGQEEYAHGFLIPVVAIWLLWSRRDALRASIGRPLWTGPIIVLIAAAMHVIGTLSVMPNFSQAGFVLALVGLALGIGGYSLLRPTLLPILFLLFAIPVPRFIDSLMSLRLQLISSKLGALFIGFFQIPVYLDGNIIDLGNYKIQVVDACSGLRYIYPLLSVSFLAAYMFQAPLWQRAMVFLSSIPITIAMNSIRIGLVGVTVDYWGTQAADGLLHSFEGWVIFLACACILMLEIHFLARISGRTFSEVFYLPKVTAKPSQEQPNQSAGQLKLATSLLLLCAVGVVVFFISGRPEIFPGRSRFVAFPNHIGQWQGQTSSLEPEVERDLVGLDDYILSDYTRSDGTMVNLYVAFYASQRKNEQLHSPNDCIPGSGWQITKFERTSFMDSGAELPLNRAVIEKQSIKQLVYYWFDERGRKIANEYLARWYLHADAVVMNRTDGALVRLVTQIHGDEPEHNADERLQAFMRDAIPSLSEYLPGETTSQTLRSSINRKTTPPEG
jgi:exosortase D (VPLPA-CTERM-specific)